MVLSVAMLALLAASFIIPVYAQGVVSSSTSQSKVQTSTALQTVTTSQSFTFTASHVVQPFLKLKVTPTGTIYAANGVDNVTIIMASGFPSFSGYQANATIQLFSSGCQTVVNKQSGANLVISYEGTLCGIAPTLTLAFSPLPTSLTSCSISWKAEAYSWCGDSGISYGGGVVTIVPPSATYDIDPTVINTGGTTTCSSTNTCSITFGSNPASGDIVTAQFGIQLLVASGAPTLSVSDSLCAAYTLGVKNNVAYAANILYEQYAYIYYCLLASSGADTVTFSSSSGNWNVAQVNIAEIKGAVTTGIVTNSATGTSASPATGSTSFTDSAPVAIAFTSFGFGGTTTLSAGSASFTAFGTLSGGSGILGASEYSTTVTSPTTFPFSSSGGNTFSWVDLGAIFAGTVAQQLNLVETVNAPPCGAIEIGAATTISTVSTLTITSTTSWTQSQVAFSGCINYGWSGATTFQQDTINPTQTEAITALSSYTTSSTLSITLTADFSAPTSTPPSSPSYLWLLILPFIFVIVLIVKRMK